MPATGTRDPESRIDQICHSCNGVDKHPRHHYLDAARTYVKHMDCCAADGCPDDTCVRILAASGNAHGDELTAYVRALAPQQHVKEND